MNKSRVLSGRSGSSKSDINCGRFPSKYVISLAVNGKAFLFSDSLVHLVGQVLLTCRMISVTHKVKVTNAISLVRTAFENIVNAGSAANVC